MFPTTVLIAAALISTALAGPWVNICASKSSNEIRTCDSYGCGQYSAQRTNRHHPGVDVLCSDGSVVYAPFTGMIVGQEKPYRNKNAINNGLRLSGREIKTYSLLKKEKAFPITAVDQRAKGSDHITLPLVTRSISGYFCGHELLRKHKGFCVKIFYIKPIKYKGSIKKGEKLGTLLPLQKVYPGIQSHVHIENCDSSDPTAYL